MIQVGDKVRVKASVGRPRYNWGDVTHKSVGIVRKVDESGEMRVDFPEMRDWMGILTEMEQLPTSPELRRKPLGASNIDVETCELYDCSVCLIQMVNRNPRLLQCSHTFCEECITQLMRNDEVNCPTCRQPTKVPAGKANNLKMNFNLLQMAEREEELVTRFQTQCQICFRRNVKVAATVRCHQCFRMMCDTCNVVHSKVKAYANHVVMEINKKNAGTDICKEHKLPITYICNSCEIGLCVDCTFETSHVEHLDEIEEFETGIKIHQEMIRTLKEDAEETLDRLKNVYDKAEDGTAIMDTIKRDIREKTQKLRDQLDMEAMELIANVEDNHKSYVSKALQPYKEAIVNMKGACTTLEKLQEQNHYDFIYNFKKERQEVLDIKAETEGVLNAKLAIPKLVPPKPGSGRLLGTLE